MLQRICRKLFTICSIILPGYTVSKKANAVKTGLARVIWGGVAVGNRVNWGRDIRISGDDFQIGDDSSIGTRARLQTPLHMGKDIMMATDVKIFRANHIIDDTSVPMNRQGTRNTGLLIIEDDVWICDSVIICPSCMRIGKGAVVAAGSVVTKDVPRYTVVAGNPAKQVKSRL